MNLAVLFFIFSIIICIRPKFHGAINNDYLSLENTLNLRGIVAISIFFHHVAQNVSSSSILLHQFHHVGYLGVAIFFFLSGYGLMTRLKSERDKKRYLVSIVSARIPYLLIVYLLVTVLYIMVKGFAGMDVRLESILDSFRVGNPIATNSWYIIVQIIFYFFFYISFSIWQKEVNKSALFLSLLILLFNLSVPFLFGWPGFIMSNFAFPMGVFFAMYKGNIDEIIQNKFLICMGGAISLFCIFSLISSPWARMVSCCAFSGIVIVLLCKIYFISSVWKFLGRISLEIYLLQGISMILFRSNKFINLENDIIWTICSLSFTIVISYLVHFVFAWIYSSLKRISK